MTALLDEFRQCEVEPRIDLRPGIHRGTEAGAAGLTAIDRDDEGLVASNIIGLVAVLACEKDPVLDNDRAELAGAHAYKRERLCRFLVFDDRETITLAAGLPEPLDRWMQKALPGMRPDSIAEQRHVGAPLEPVTPGVLLIGPSDREVIENRNRVVDDGTLVHDRADDPVAAAREATDNLLQNIPLDSDLGAEPARRRA